MPISRVQTKSASVNPATTVSVTFDSATASGNLIVLCVGNYYAGVNAGGAWTASDNKGNTWASAGVHDVTSGKIQIFYAANITGGASHQVTITVAGAATYTALTAVEYSGAATVSPFDQFAASRTTASQAAYASPATATTAQADELLVGFHHGFQATATPTPDSPWSTAATLNAGGLHVQTVQDRIVSATGAYSSTGTWSAAGANHTDAIATFKAAAGGGAASYEETIAFASTAALSQGAQLAAGASVAMAATAGMSDSGPIGAAASLSLAVTASMGPAAQLQAAAGLLLAAGVGLAPLTRLAVDAGLGLNAVAAFAAESSVAGGGTSYSESLAMAASAQMSQAAALMAAGTTQFLATAGMAQVSQVQVAAALNLAAAVQLQALATLDGVDGPMADFLIGAAEYLVAEYAAGYAIPQAAAAYQIADYRTEYLA